MHTSAVSINMDSSSNQSERKELLSHSTINPRSISASFMLSIFPLPDKEMYVLNGGTGADGHSDRDWNELSEGRERVASDQMSNIIHAYIHTHTCIFICHDPNSRYFAFVMYEVHSTVQCFAHTAAKCLKGLTANNYHSSPHCDASYRRNLSRTWTTSQ